MGRIQLGPGPFTDRRRKQAEPLGDVQALDGVLPSSQAAGDAALINFINDEIRRLIPTEARGVRSAPLACWLQHWDHFQRALPMLERTGTAGAVPGCHTGGLSGARPRACRNRLSAPSSRCWPHARRWNRMIALSCHARPAAGASLNNRPPTPLQPQKTESKMGSTVPPWG